jgi:1-acyl-sn-glycerol-3-phosphate acyltransferase
MSCPTKESRSPVLTDSSQGAPAGSASPPSRVTARWLHPVRFALRALGALVWTLAVYGASVCLAGVGLLLPKWARAVRARVVRGWMNGVLALTGVRVHVEGTPPAPPFFLVSNHLSWLDGFAVNSVVDAAFVAMAETRAIPLIGRIGRGIDMIYADRSNRREVPRLNAAIAETIKRGRGVFMCPEGVVGPGREVRRFRGALFEHAVQDGRPVHYVTITYRTPPGCPPASQVCLFGPDPYYRTPDGEIPESELEAWGPERSFLPYLYGLLGLPHFDIVLTFGEAPISGSVRVALANAVHDAVAAQFVPLG